MTIHIFLSQHLSMLNYFLNFPQHVQKGTVSLENMYYMVAGKKINIYVLNTYIQELIKNICWILVTFKILPAKISNLLSCPWTLQLISKPDFKWCILNKIFFYVQMKWTAFWRSIRIFMSLHFQLIFLKKSLRFRTCPYLYSMLYRTILTINLSVKFTCSGKFDS